MARRMTKEEIDKLYKLVSKPIEVSQATLNWMTEQAAKAMRSRLIAMGA